MEGMLGFSPLTPTYMSKANPPAEHSMDMQTVEAILGKISKQKLDLQEEEEGEPEENGEEGHKH